LNQISCKLSSNFIGYINLAVVFMIWMLIIEEKLKEKEEIYESKQKDYAKELEIFMARTSQDEEKNVNSDIDQLISKFVELLKTQI
jgi:anaerobic ribonucleoside-triphosphate reductase